MAAKLVTKGQFARICQVSAPAVTKQLRGELGAALVGDKIDLEHPAAQKYLAIQTKPRPAEPVPGVDPLFSEALALCQKTGRWSASNISRSLNMGYARAQRIYGQLAAAGHCSTPKVVPPTEQAAAPREVRTVHTGAKLDPIVEVPDELSELVDWPLGKLLAVYGTAAGFHGWLKALKDLEMVNEKRIKNAQYEGKLVSKELVKTGILGPIEGMCVKLLTDAITTMSSRAHAMAHAGEDERAIKAMMEDQLASFIRPTKDRMRRVLGDA